MLNESVSDATKNLFSHWAWILFIAHEFFILICLLNFLIAIVSQSYDNIMNNQEMETTMSKVYLNNEASIIFDAIDLMMRYQREPSQTFHMRVCLDSYETQLDEF